MIRGNAGHAWHGTAWLRQRRGEPRVGPAAALVDYGAGGREIPPHQSSAPNGVNSSKATVESRRHRGGALRRAGTERRGRESLKFRKFMSGLFLPSRLLDLTPARFTVPVWSSTCHGGPRRRPYAPHADEPRRASGAATCCGQADRRQQVHAASSTLADDLFGRPSHTTGVNAPAGHPADARLCRPATTVDRDGQAGPTTGQQNGAC